MEAKINVIESKDGKRHLCADVVQNGGLLHYVIRELNELKPQKIAYKQTPGGADGGTLYY